MINWLKKLLGESEKKAPDTKPDKHSDVYTHLKLVRTGRYSDNNKSQKKTEKWHEAEHQYKEKNFLASLETFFEYLRDDEADNVHYEKEGGGFRFDIMQGSGKIFGSCDGKTIVAKLGLAVMEYPGTAVMRRLLDLNYNLYYCHTAMDDANTLYLVFDSSVSSASPEKMYQGLREMAVKGDKADDLLLSDFTTLKRAEDGRIKLLSNAELDIKYKYFKGWLEEVLADTEKLNQDSFAGAIAYMLLGTIYRIDFLLMPQGKLLSELESIHRIYWEKKEEHTLVERNKQMRNAISKLLNFSKEDFNQSLYYSKKTFAISSPPKSDKVREYINNANNDAKWYIEHKYPEVALRLNEYGALYSQFIYSVPDVQTLLVKIYMAVIQSDFFNEMGLQSNLYQKGGKGFDKAAIEEAVDASLDVYKDKFPYMKWNHDRIKYNSLYDFGISFTEQIGSLTLETKRST